MSRPSVWAGRLRWVLLLSLALNGGVVGAWLLQQSGLLPVDQAEARPETCPHEALCLTPEQSDRWNDASQALWQEIQTERRQLDREQGELLRLMVAEPVDRPAITDQLARIAAIQQAVQTRLVDHYLEQKHHLTPDQCQAFGEILRQRVCPHDAGLECGGRPPLSPGGVCGRPPAGVD